MVVLVLYLDLLVSAPILAGIRGKEEAEGEGKER